MPRFLFHICDGDRFIEDRKGTVLADRNGAYREAIRRARSLMVDEVIEGRLNGASFIEVEDSEGAYLFTVTFEEAVEIEPEAPPGPMPRGRIS